MNLGERSESADENTPTHEHHRPINKAIMDGPQEEFIEPEAVPSHNVSAMDHDHGDEVEQAKKLLM